MPQVLIRVIVDRRFLRVVYPHPKHREFQAYGTLESLGVWITSVFCSIRIELYEVACGRCRFSAVSAVSACITRLLCQLSGQAVRWPLDTQSLFHRVCDTSLLLIDSFINFLPFLTLH